jgi:hypothetical protein
MELPFKIVEVAPTGNRLIAAADNLTVARAIRYGRGAVAEVPFDLRQKAGVILDSGSQPGGLINPCLLQMTGVTTTMTHSVNERIDD